MTLPADTDLRPVGPGDAALVAPLLAQLGYPASETDVEARLACVREGSHLTVMLATSGGRALGLAVGEIGWSLNRSGPQARLALLVVDESCRRQGVGRVLLRWFEDWARERGVSHATLTSAHHRGQAHAFYRRCGWEATGLRFARELR